MVGDAFAKQMDANDLLSRYRSLTAFDIRDRPEGRQDNALRTLHARCLLMPCPTDHLLPIEDAIAMHGEIPDCRLIPIESELGHWSASQPPGSVEFEQVCRATRQFMECPPNTAA
jgi:homoserine acetyltransferase